VLRHYTYLTNVTCPACDGKQVVDAKGKPYKVLCDNQLFADDNDGIGHSTTPQGCLMYVKEMLTAHLGSQGSS